MTSPVAGLSTAIVAPDGEVTQAPSMKQASWKSSGSLRDTPAAGADGVLAVIRLSYQDYPSWQILNPPMTQSAMQSSIRR